MGEITQGSATTTDDTAIWSEMKRADATETKKEEEEGVADVAEISVELKQLLQPLEGKNEPWSLGRVRVENDGKHTRIMYRMFDTTDRSYKPVKECRVLLGAQANLRVLQAIGSCKTLKAICAEGLTGKELEALLTPMESNPVLEHISIESPYSSATDESEERICEILGRILQTSCTLDCLQLYSCGLSAAGACHLARGVRGNADSGLEVLQTGKWEESTVANQIAEIVLSAPRLVELEVWGGASTVDDGIDALANALARSTSLKRLTLGGELWGASALLLKTLTGDHCNKSIATLTLKGVMEGVGEFLPQLLSANQSLKELACGNLKESPSPRQWQSVARSFSSSSSLEIFKIRAPWSSFPEATIDGGESMLNALDLKDSCVGLYLNSQQSATRTYPWLSPSEWRDEETRELLREIHTKNPVIELHFFPEVTGDLSTLWISLAEALYSKGAHVSSLYLQMGPKTSGAKGGEVDNFFRAIRMSSSLRLLTVDGGNGDYWPGGWTKLINSLRSNTSITHLRFIDCNDLDEDVFKMFMGVLQVNLTLKRIRLSGTSWETDGKKALIKEALRRNAVQDSYFSTFRKHGLQFQPATTGRLFLCGSPLAGKTKLRQTMVRIFRGNCWLGDKFAQLRRTKGVEVELLKDDEEMQIAVWDLAGQWIFRSLQNILFPQTNHTSIFLFVYNPYDREKGCIKEDLDQCLKRELEDWLRFIASNSQVTGRMLPKVLVVMSHMDKMQHPHEFLWAKSIVRELGEEFHNILDVCGTLYQVNACSKRQVTPLKDFIFELFRDLLQDKALIAPRVCAQISSLLANRTKNIKHHPLWSFQEFYIFCSDSLQDETGESLKPDMTSQLEVFKAMASYLHDIGSIIIIPSLDKIIVDPNWLTNIFLGELITIGHNFQDRGKAVQKSKTDILFSRTGFISSSELEFLLSSFLRKHPEFRES